MRFIYDLIITDRYLVALGLLCLKGVRLAFGGVVLVELVVVEGVMLQLELYEGELR